MGKQEECDRRLSDDHIWSQPALTAEQIAVNLEVSLWLKSCQHTGLGHWNFFSKKGIYSWLAQS